MSIRNLLVRTIVSMMVVPMSLAEVLVTSIKADYSAFALSVTTSRPPTLLDQYNEVVAFVAVGGVVTIVVAVIIIVVVCVIQAIYKRELSPRRATADENSVRERNSVSGVNVHHNSLNNDGSPPPNGEAPGEFTGSLREFLACRQSNDPGCSAFAHTNVSNINKERRSRELGTSPVQLALDGPTTAATGNPRLSRSSIPAHAGIPMPTPTPDVPVPRISAHKTVRTAHSPDYESLNMKSQLEHAVNVSSVPGGGPNDHALPQPGMIYNNKGNARNEAFGTHELVPVATSAIQSMHSHNGAHNRPSYEGLGKGVHNAYIPPLTRIASAPSDYSLDSLGRVEKRKQRSDSFVAPAGKNTVNSDASSKSSHSIRSAENNPHHNVNKFETSRVSHVSPTHRDVPVHNVEIDGNLHAEMAHDDAPQNLPDCYSDEEDVQRGSSYVPSRVSHVSPTHRNVPVRNVEINVGAGGYLDVGMAHNDAPQSLPDCYSDEECMQSGSSYVPPVQSPPAIDGRGIPLTERQNLSYIPPLKSHSPTGIDIIVSSSYAEGLDDEDDVDAEYSDPDNSREDVNAVNKTTAAAARYQYI